MSFTVLLDNYIEASAQIAVRDQLQTAQDELKAGGLQQQVYRLHQARPAFFPHWGSFDACRRSASCGPLTHSPSLIDSL